MKLLEPVVADEVMNFSWWQQDLREKRILTRCPPLEGTHSTDYLIVGGGFTGLWTAISLKERDPDAAVTIVEAYRCGDGASSRNGGNVHGYWTALPVLIDLFGPDKAIEAARLGTLAQQRLRNFATAPGRDIWWFEKGYLRVSTSPAQQKKVQIFLAVARELGVSDTITHLNREELAQLCNSPFFKEGLLFHEGATVHPALLADELRSEAMVKGVKVYEGTKVVSIEKGLPNLVTTDLGQVRARNVILATYTGTLVLPRVKASNTLFSSFPLMSHADPDALEQMGYREAYGIADLRMFTHYFRRTRDGRILMGTGSGPVGFGTRHNTANLRWDRKSGDRAKVGLRHFFPQMPEGAAKAWGFPIEVSADRLPFFGQVEGARIFYGSGYSGHGVNACCIAGECLSSLAMDKIDQWSTSVFVKRRQVKFPPEPFRFVGGEAIRASIVDCEDAEDAGLPQPKIAGLVSRVPALLNLKIGTR